MMAAIPAKLGSEAEAGRSKAQHVIILAFYSKIAGITCSARPDDALNPRLGDETGLSFGIAVNNLTGGVPNGECRFTMAINGGFFRGMTTVLLRWEKGGNSYIYFQSRM
jgi:hypothetical protein